MKKLIHKKAFSLIELSVVIVVISVLVSGILASDHLVRISRISAARSVTLSSQIVTIPGMVAWFETTYKESFIAGQATDKSQITTWYNLEPSNFLEKNNLTTSASNNVTYKEKSINNLPAVNFTTAGNIKITEFFGIGSVSNPSIFIVFRPTIAPDTTAKIIIDSGASGGISIGVTNSQIILSAGSNSGINASVTIGGSYILLTSFNGTSSQVFLNSTTNLVGSLSPGSNIMNGLTIGSDHAGANGIQAEIMEVIVFSRNLNTKEIYDVMNYLSKKYKINVSGL